ncbi:MAG TPA: 4-alpha-glucanotransferase [Candidatus Binataceae bacterium]|nr:4-alpha-glucanotransferase [Candidatus Binataceae bacterium]
MMKRAAAMLLPLFSLRSDNDLGRGEIRQLCPFAQWMLQTGHRVLQFLPLTESAAGENSPYSALSIFSIDPLYISVGELAGVPGGDLQRAREQVGGRRSIPRAELRALKFSLLAAAFMHFRDHGGAGERAGFAQFAAENQHWLPDYALFRAIKDRLQWADWKQWPAEVRDRHHDTMASARHQLAEPVAMYSYWQYLARRQWAQTRAELAGLGVSLIGDLAFLPACDSSDVWANQHLFMLDRLVGAPPDAFSAKGQRWGLPMPNWPRMRDDGLRWWRERARHGAQLFDALRIDHVVGFYRTYSFDDDPDAAGAFYPLAEDAQREQGEAFFTMLKQEVGDDTLIGEDLGTVPPWVRVSLSALGVMGLKVLRWEKVDWRTPRERFIAPAQYAERSVAVTGTHDTETLAQWWRELPPVERTQLAKALNFPKALNLDASRLDMYLLDAILEPLYAAPSRIVSAPIQDLFGWEDRINLPGSIDEDNWTYRLPQTIEQLSADHAICQRAAKLQVMAQRTGRF